ncbi:MAG TPA: tRNA (N(6)-L-threonylcarbamoyladenosine(37)-C(2))-methylthiotransferase MtaB [Vicinamibacteria bacterium]|nr:tRNA (N(6)-L-threonylcarbamoyladenosine(37)-C(2))-methylthiotransferase MtaB [Vicinamibacteria bacterium]
MHTASFHSLGCRLNQTEAASWAGAFRDKGYAIVEWGEPADVVVINTCSVTERGEASCRNAIRKALRRRADAFVVVTGCYAQVGLEALRAIPGVDLIVGTEYKDKFPSLIDEPRKLPEPAVLHSNLIDDSDFEVPGTGHYETTRANLKVQDGCDFFCSFCIIPFTRGRERSRKLPDLLREARALTVRGFREIVLTGVNIGRYEHEGTSFDGMIGWLEGIDGLDRIRITSIEPTTIETSLVDRMALSRKLCRYLHVPVQSGDETVLRAMNRRYTPESYRRFLEEVVDKVPEVGLGTDVIVGFPGETDASFDKTYRFLESLPFAYLHVFSYSKRYGTRATRLEGHVGPDAIKHRSQALRALSDDKRRAFGTRYVGREVEVLFEQKDENGLWVGLTDNYLRVGVVSDEPLKNELRRVVVRSASNDLALGSITAGQRVFR